MTSIQQVENFKPRHGATAFTLLEMVLVIAILAVLSLVAVRSLSGIEDQTRFDATRSQLGNIDQAVLGNPNEHDSDGSPYILSFVGDIGRLPIAIGSDPTTGMQLQELWANPNALLPLAPRQAISDPDVWLTTGWRGGYLRLGINQTTLQDSWNTPYDCLHANGTTPCAGGDPIEIIRSRGADLLVDTAPTTGFNGDQYLYFNNASTTLGLPVVNRYASTISGGVYLVDSSGQPLSLSPAMGDIVLKFYGPDPATGGIAEPAYLITPVTNAAGFTSATYSIPATVGSRVIRAYQGTNLYAASGAPATFAAAAATISIKSSPVRLTVTAGGVMKDLVMRMPATQPSAPATQPSGT